MEYQHSKHSETPDAHRQHELHNMHEHTRNNHHKMMIADFRNRFWVSLILSVPVLVLSPFIQSILTLNLVFDGKTYVLFALSSIIFFYGGWPFFKGLKDELKKRTPGMMTLIAIAITVAYTYSSAVTFGLNGKMFFWELVALIDIMLVGHWIEMKSVLEASGALELLVSMMPAKAHKVHGSHIMDINLKELNKDDIILIKPGEKVPADGTVIEGESYLNESMLTGESKLVKKLTGHRVIGGSVNTKGSLKVKVIHTGEDSYLSKVINLVQEAQKAKSKSLADRAAKWLTYIAIGVGIATLAVWLLSGFNFEYALERMVTVMVISCPHALGLAIPLVVAISTTISAQNGLLIRNNTAFENSRKISTILFDKTGTLTKGDFGVTRYEAVSTQFDEKELLRLAGTLEQNSEHPIAVAIMKKIRELNISISRAENFNAIAGKGVEARVEDNDVKVVSPGYLKDKDIAIPEMTFRNAAETIVFVIVNGQLAGFIALADNIRPESKEAILQFKKENIKVIMATGDNRTVAKAVSDELGLDGYYAEKLPHQKAEIIKELQKEGEFVAMTGDGLNDAPALAQADIGIAVGSGTDVAAETADIILVNSSPKDILNLILFGKATYRKMIQNLIWATAYNAFAIPLAAGVLFWAGFILSPAIGAAVMSLSTIIVAINARLLKNQIKREQ